ncbi:neuronal acetylcholine receptor subunit alpha-5-like [Ylistrum balloti]|uniref:neuronal acetylcholine receptor subunit alpha-5-like n=1 Tax=Ylistrum balloti TaxID=509963 RepID=UPI002905D334|nr:neuronal acetylcholine receptor subunit alpha-5-like [Ylistrum balloti]
MHPTLTFGLMAVLATITGCHCLLEKKLVKDLLNDYDTNVIPITAEEPLVTVDHGLTVISIRKFDRHLLELNTWSSMMWIDPSLKWVPSKYNNVNMVSVFHDQVWIPDVTTYNTYHPEPIMKDIRVAIKDNGLVIFVPQTKTVLTCKVSTDAEEVYTCHVKLGSWTYSGNKMDLVNSGGIVDMSEYSVDDDWVITNTTVVRNVDTYSCCTESYISLLYTIELKPRHHRHC